MAKPVVRRTRKYFRHLAKHLRKLFRSKESAKEAVSGMAKDTADYAQKVLRRPSSHDHKLAVRAVQRGKTQYNGRRYIEAIQSFREALEYDQTYGRAYLYLGNALYQNGEEMPARRAWKRATEVDPTSDSAVSALRKLEKFEVDAKSTVTFLQEKMGPR